MRVAVSLSLWLLWVANGAAAAEPRAVVDTWAALSADMPRAPAARTLALLRFANDDAPAVNDRLRAVRAAYDSMASLDARRIDARLLEARLLGAVGRNGMRRNALNDARRLAQRAGQTARAAAVVEALAAELARERVHKHLRRGRPPVAEDAETLTRGLPALLTIGDERLHALTRVSLVQLRLHVPSTGTSTEAAAVERDKAVRELADIVDALGTVRLHAAARAEVLEVRAQTLEALGRAAEAAHDLVAADRERAVQVNKPARVAHPHAPYVRSARTAAACRALRRDKNTCAQVEQARYGARTFHDFSLARPSALGPEQADAVLAEYESLLFVCWEMGVRDQLTTNTHIELELSVNQDGRISGYDLRPTRLRNTAVDTCVKDAVTWFRAPRYRGEQQHIRVAFDVGDAAR